VPQETKSMPAAQNASAEGIIPPMTTEAEVRAAVDLAFDYRGDVTVTLKDNRVLEGYVFDRRQEAGGLGECVMRLIPRDSNEKISIRYSDLSHIAFTGRDTAAGKSFQTWVAKYREKKLAGEHNIRLEPEKLE